MQEQKRFVNFIIMAMMILLIWSTFIAPRLFPPPPKAKPPVTAEADADTEAAEAEAQAEAEQAETPAKLHEYPDRADVAIGSSDFNSGYRMQVKFDSLGASLTEVLLIDPRYHDLAQPKQPLSIIKVDPSLTARPLQTTLPKVDAVLKKFGKTLNSVHWDVVKEETNESTATWRYVTPDDRLEIRKRFELSKVDPKQVAQEHEAYGIKFQLTIKNLSDKAAKLHYVMFGPVGLPIENRYYTQKTRDVALGFVTADGTLTPKLMTPDAIWKNEEAQRVEEWRTPLKYAGVDVQYFTALLLPKANQTETPYFESAKAVFLDAVPKDIKGETKYRNATVELKSTELELAAAGAKQGAADVTHEFILFAGPKHADLLAPYGAERIIDYGISGRLGVPQTLLMLLSIFQRALSFLPYPYGWSIILLTILVRSCMFPLSRKQALAAAKMQELQPELTALKEKYKNQPEKFAKAQMELFSKNNCSPLGGCLPALVQLPIFFGLYQAFNISVDMRGAPFFWIDNLAAPDALFNFPFVLPLLGPSFNLLPILTVCLFLAQQKMLMPPPTTPEMEMQQKMFFYMTIFMGYMFYSVAAGLCVYFIASSLWGLAERRLLPKRDPANGVLATTTAQGKNGTIAVDVLGKPKPKKGGGAK